jgi:hypothetical protein
LRRTFASLLTAIAVLAVPLPAAGANPLDPLAQLRPIDLQVSGGEDSWHADNDFRLDWDHPPVAEQGFAVTAVDYRVRDAGGVTVVPEIHLPWSATEIEHIHVPPNPGAYTVDVWLEGPEGGRGPRESATLRFDDVRPGAARPLAPNNWIAGNAAVVLKLGHPAGPLPISGIRGYAVSVDRGAENPPCAGPARCRIAETDLTGGIDDDSISLGSLPEGANVVRAVAVSGAGMRSVETRSAIVRVDATRPEVSLRGTPQRWAPGPVRLTATATDVLSGVVASGPSGPYTAIAIDGGVPRVDPGNSVTVVVSGEGTHNVASYAQDAAGNNGEGAPELATVRIDEGAPQVAFARSQDRGDPERIEALVADSLSGADPQRGSIAVRPAGSRARFEPLPTAASGGRLLTRWDSDAFPPGTYEFRATGYDIAGNVGVSDRRAGGARMVLANPLKTPIAIEAGFGGRRPVLRHCRGETGQRRCRRRATRSFEERPTSRVVPYGRATVFGGRLTSSSATPLGGLPVEVIETFATGASSLRHSTTVLTAPDGSFTSRLSPGPSREVEAVFAGNRVLTRASGGQVRLRVLAGVRLHASATSARVGGAPVVFSGRIESLGAPIPADGRPVELQFRLAGGDWAEFRTVQTDAHGRFRYPYAFSDDDSRGIRFQFRAYAPAEDDWPYEPTGSKPVSVTGR